LEITQLLIFATPILYYAPLEHLKQSTIIRLLKQQIFNYEYFARGLHFSKQVIFYFEAENEFYDALLYEVIYIALYSGKQGDLFICIWLIWVEGRRRVFDTAHI